MQEVTEVGATCITRSQMTCRPTICQTVLTLYCIPCATGNVCVCNVCIAVMPCFQMGTGSSRSKSFDRQMVAQFLLSTMLRPVSSRSLVNILCCKYMFNSMCMTIVRASYCEKSSFKGGVFIFVHKNLKFTTVNLNSYFSDYDIKIHAVKLLSVLSHIRVFST